MLYTEEGGIGDTEERRGGRRQLFSRGVRAVLEEKSNRDGDALEGDTRDGPATEYATARKSTEEGRGRGGSPAMGRVRQRKRASYDDAIEGRSHHRLAFLYIFPSL